MAAYGAFGLGSIVLVSLVVLLAHVTQRELTPDPDGGAQLGERPLSAQDLYANMVVSQLVVAGLFAGLVWLAGVPITALGIDLSPSATEVVLAIALGVGIYLLDEGGVRLLDHVGLAYDEGLRRALAPAGPGGWAFLLIVVLPVIAIVEELIFRGILIGALASGFAVPTAVLVVVSTVAFAIGHGLQGTGGVLVTGALGLLLAIAFVATGSLLLVVVAHYLVNALEFVVHEGVGSQS